MAWRRMLPAITMREHREDRRSSIVSAAEMAWLWVYFIGRVGLGGCGILLGIFGGR